MSCPICGRIMCDHTPAERGQSMDEMMTDYAEPGPINQNGDEDICLKCGTDLSKRADIKNNALCFGLTAQQYHGIHCEGKKGR